MTYIQCADVSNECYRYLTEKYLECLVILHGACGDGYKKISQIMMQMKLSNLELLYVKNVDKVSKAVQSVANMKKYIVANMETAEPMIINRGPADILKNYDWERTFDIKVKDTLLNAFPYVYKNIEKLFSENQLPIEMFFFAIHMRKKLRFAPVEWFWDALEYRFSEESMFINNKTYYFDNNGVWVDGDFDTIECIDENGRLFEVHLNDYSLVRYICKYMENELRIISRFKNKISYKAYFCENYTSLMEDDFIPDEIKENYRRLKVLTESWKLRNAIYQGVDDYVKENSAEYDYWFERYANKT